MPLEVATYASVYRRRLRHATHILHCQPLLRADTLRYAEMPYAATLRDAGYGHTLRQGYAAVSY